MSAASWIEIDLGALEANLAAVGGVIAPAEVCPVVKANGYGLGAVPIARRLSAAGVPLMAVYDTDQATELVSAGINTPLLVLMPVWELARTDALYRAAVAGRLHLTAHSLPQIDAIEQIGTTFGSPMPIHIEVDTGMSRCGMPVDEAEQALRAVRGRRYLRLAGLFTHPASADCDLYYTSRQLSAFEALMQRTADCLHDDTTIHFANTHAMLRGPEYHKAMVRLGLSLYGYGQEDLSPGPAVRDLPPLRPTMRWMSQVVHILDVPTGTPVGYGGTFTTWRDSRIGVVPGGYADGYPVSLSNKGIVRVGPQRVPVEVRGKVNMDQLIIDLTGVEGAELGMEVELYSNDPAAPNALPEVAARAQTSCYELLCRLSPRLTRRYVTPDAAGQARHVATTRR
jgi:alanine racemase